jgi:anti-sigma-K factor RskA
MSAHEQFAEDLALYALGALTGPDREALEQHLSTCPGCRHELEQLRGDTALLAMSVTGPRPPQRARQRLLDAIAREPRDVSAPAAAKFRGAFRWWGALGWAMAVGMLLAVIQARNENSKLRSSLEMVSALVKEQTTELADAKRLVETLTAPDTEPVTLVAAKTPRQPQGKAFYLRQKTSLIFIANNLPPVAPEKVYELWLIPKTGPPIPAGLFRPDAHGSATVVNPPLPAGVEAKNFVVTLEPESGNHDAPRGRAVMSGAGL